MSQTSLVESSSSGEAPHNALLLRLEAPLLSQTPISLTKQSFNIQGRYVYETGTSLVLPRIITSPIAVLKPAIHGKYKSAAFYPVKYDDDLTLYSGEKMNISFSFAAGLGPTPLIVIRGQKRGTIQGSIVMEKSGRSCKFQHMIPIERALTKAEEDKMQALMQKRGYRDSDDWKKKLLLTVKEKSAKFAKWIDEYGTVVAVEKDDKLEFSGEIQTEKKDPVVACWACKEFVLEKTT